MRLISGGRVTNEVRDKVPPMLLYEISQNERFWFAKSLFKTDSKQELAPAVHVLLAGNGCMMGLAAELTRLCMLFIMNTSKSCLPMSPPPPTCLLLPHGDVCDQMFYNV